MERGCFHKPRVGGTACIEESAGPSAKLAPDRKSALEMGCCKSIAGPPADCALSKVLPTGGGSYEDAVFSATGRTGSHRLRNGSYRRSFGLLGGPPPASKSVRTRRLFPSARTHPHPIRWRKPWLRLAAVQELEVVAASSSAHGWCSPRRIALASAPWPRAPDESARTRMGAAIPRASSRISTEPSKGQVAVGSSTS